MKIYFFIHLFVFLVTLTSGPSYSYSMLDFQREFNDASFISLQSRVDDALRIFLRPRSVGFTLSVLPTPPKVSFVHSITRISYGSVPLIYSVRLSFIPTEFMIKLERTLYFRLLNGRELSVPFFRVRLFASELFYPIEARLPLNMTVFPAPQFSTFTRMHSVFDFRPGSMHLREGFECLFLAPVSDCLYCITVLSFFNLYYHFRIFRFFRNFLF